MKNFISILFYITIGLFPIGIIFRTQNLPGGGIALTLGFLGLLIYFIAKSIKDIITNQKNRLNFSLQILIVLMSIVLFSKYMYHSFGDYPSLIIVPFFIIMSLLYFFKNKTKHLKLSIATIAYLILSIPLFGLTYHKSPIHYIPQHWYNRYDVHDEGIPVSLPYDFKYEETEELNLKAFNLNNSGQYYEAITIYEKALNLEPDNTLLLFNLSESYAMTNDLEKAIVLLDKAIMIDSTCAAFYNNRGLLYFKLIENNKAAFDFNKAIEIDSTNYVFFANLTLVYYYQNLFDKSCEALEKAEQLGLDIESSKELKRIKKDICQ